MHQVQGFQYLIPIYFNLQVRTENKLAHALHITFSISTGAYVPLTTEDTIIVDGMLASCYADFDHDLAHLIVTPMQKFSEIVEWLFGNDFGFPVYVGTARQLGELILPNGQYYSC